MEKKLDYLVDKAVELGASEAKVIKTEGIVFDSRSYLKCRFGCGRWGKYWTCPPHLDITPERFEQLCDEFRSPHLWTRAGGEWKLRHPVWEAEVVPEAALQVAV